jgi:hypothetical protein
MNIQYNDRISKLLSLAKEQGFTIERSRKSFKIIPPNKNKQIIYFSCTPSDVNAYWEIRRYLKKSGCIC